MRYGGYYTCKLQSSLIKTDAFLILSKGKCINDKRYDNRYCKRNKYGIW